MLRPGDVPRGTLILQLGQPTLDVPRGIGMLRIQPSERQMFHVKHHCSYVAVERLTVMLHVEQFFNWSNKEVPLVVFHV